MSERIKPVALHVAFNNEGTEGVMGKPTAEQIWEDYSRREGVSLSSLLLADGLLMITFSCSLVSLLHDRAAGALGASRRFGRPQRDLGRGLATDGHPEPQDCSRLRRGLRPAQ